MPPVLEGIAAAAGLVHKLDSTRATPVLSALCAQVTAAAEALVKKLHDARAFTDTANFTLRCGVCNQGLKGEKEALEHAKSTGHQNFQEY